MIKWQFEVKNKKGIHARIAAKIVEGFNNLDVDVFASKVDGKEKIKATSIIDLLLLNASYGSWLEFHIEGKEQEKAYKFLKKLVVNNFGEES